MLQRVQSLYLSLAFILIVLTFVFPVVNYSFYGNNIQGYHFSTANNELLILKLNEAGSVFFMVLMVFLLAAVGIMSLVSVFMYKKRVMQNIVVASAVLLNVVFIICMYFFIDGLETKLSSKAHPEIGAVFPLIAVVLMYLAGKAIRKDEARVRAADRLRKT